VQELLSSAGEVRAKLKGFGDLERVLSRIGSGRAGPRDVAALRDSLARLPGLREVAFAAPLLKEASAAVGDHGDLCDLLSRALADRPAALLTEGGIIREKYHGELDRLRGIASGGKSWLAEFERREAERTGIPSLKVGYNRVFGYYIEVTNLHSGKVPADFVRKQTLKNAERYITPELKEYETEVLQAEDRSKRLEQEIFTELREKAAADLAPLQATAEAVARLDVLASLAIVARELDYVRPAVDDSEALEIDEGRHPVVERLIDERFVPNDARVGGKTRLLLITGPNMSGKSTYIRQTALLALLAQMGSFVPAKRMRLGIVDRIFTRVGAADDVSRGASTFMVEMNETANILNHATSKSLLILDEVGRGTSTFDGVSIAWAVAEYLHDRVGARTLFATHYHELTELAAVLSGVKNLHVAVREWGESIVFLHQIVEGATDRSYGIHVARLAGIPRKVVDRAKKILADLEELSLEKGDRPRMARKPRKGELQQLSLFDAPAPEPKEDPLRGEMRELDPNALTPLQALQKLMEWKAKYGK
jgi:DNA mismatch repair protein MutS